MTNKEKFKEPSTKNDLGVDCISREQALVAIRNLYPSMPRVDFNGSLRKWVDKYKPYIECDDAIEQLPSVIPQEPRWIPVSERLPEKNMSCLVSVGEFHFTEIAMYSDLMGTIDHKIFWQGHYGKDNYINITKYVCAWMPLPRDYREVKD